MRSSRPLTSVKLRAYRRKRRAKAALAAGVILAGSAAGLVFLSRADTLSITEVALVNESLVSDAEIRRVADSFLDKRTLFVFSGRNSVFFSTSRLEAAILHGFPAVGSLTADISRGRILTVKVGPREKSALWCGETRVAGGDCYFMDASGFVFARAPSFSGAVFDTYYGALLARGGQALADPADPVGAIFAGEEALATYRSFFDFLRGLSFVPEELERHDTFFDIALDTGMIIRVSSADAPARVFDRLERFIASDATRDPEGNPVPLHYIDLRFGNKVYYKKR